MSTARVTTPDDVVTLAEDDVLTFGRARSCTVCLDPDDVGISRVTGTIQFVNDTWWVVNNSSTRPLTIVDDLGFRSVLPPGRRVAVQQQTRILVQGRKGRYGLRVDVGDPAMTDAAFAAQSPVDQSSGASTAVGNVLITPADRRALVALFMGYLMDPPRYDPHPKSYAAAAKRLGCTRTAVIKRIEYLRKRLDAAGVPNMMGYAALNNLAEYVISRGLITRKDLSLLQL
jgi:hypothetical protein